MNKKIDNIDKYINKLISGISYIIYDNNVYEIRPASIRLKQQAAMYYDILIDSFKYKGIKSQEKFFKVCVKKQILPEDYKKIMEEDSQKIDDLKIDLYKAGPRITAAKKIRDKLAFQRKAQNKFLDLYYELKSNTLEGLAEHARRTFIFMNSIYDHKGNQLFSSDIFNDCEVDAGIYNLFTQAYSQQLMSEYETRSIARSGIWRSMWNHRKHDIFRNDISELTEEQKLLVTYSEIYDFAYNYSTPPKENIFEDDDVFDGWYLHTIKKLKNERDGKKSSDDKYDDKYQEVFVLAQDQEEANSIYDSNSQESKKILKARAHVMNNKKEVRDVDLPDIQNDLRIQALEKFKAQMSGKN